MYVAMPRSRYVTILFLVLLAASGLLVLRLLWVFVGAIVLALVLVSLFQPMHQKLTRWLGGRERVAAGLTTLAVVLGVVVPVALFAITLSRRALELYSAVRERPLYGQLMGFVTGDSVLAHRLRSVLGAFGLEFGSGDVDALAGGAMKEVGYFLYERMSGLAANAITLTVQFAIMVVLVFTLLVDGARLKSFLMDLSPLPDDEEQVLINRFKMISRAVFLGNGFASMLQGVFGGIGFALFGLGSGVLWGTAMGFLALLPIAGASVIFVPAAGYLLATGRPALAIAFLAYNLFYVAVLEYGLKPRLIGSNSRMHAVLVFLAILGGLGLFGILGIFYGPLIATMFLALVELYKLRYRRLVLVELSASEPGPAPIAEPSDVRVLAAVPEIQGE